MPERIHNRLINNNRRTSLRKNQTYPEQLLWQELRGKALGYKFRRQHGIGNYIVDFYCKQLSLVIELDGDSHFDEKSIQQDIKRDKYLKSLGLTVLRFTNLEMTQNLSGVLEHLQAWILNREN